MIYMCRKRRMYHNYLSTTNDDIHVYCVGNVACTTTTCGPQTMIYMCRKRGMYHNYLSTTNDDIHVYETSHEIRITILMIVTQYYPNIYLSGCHRPVVSPLHKSRTMHVGVAEAEERRSSQGWGTWDLPRPRHVGFSEVEARGSCRGWGNWSYRGWGSGCCRGWVTWNFQGWEAEQRCVILR